MSQLDLSSDAKQGDIKKARRTEEKPVKMLSMFSIVEPEGANAVTEEPQWQAIELAVDSGASETVVGESMLPCVETKEGPASKRGVMYEVANGIRIPNLGEKAFQGYTDGEGIKRGIKAQV